MPREQHIKVYRSTGSSLPLPFSVNANGPTFGELAYVDGLTTLYIGKSDGSRAWIGAEVTGGDIEQGLEYAVPTMKAVKDYVVFKSLDAGAYFIVRGEDGLTHDIVLSADNVLTLTGGLGIDVVKSAGEDDNTLIFRAVTGSATQWGVLRVNSSGPLFVDTNGLNVQTNAKLFTLRDEVGNTEVVGYDSVFTLTGGRGVDVIDVGGTFEFRGVTATTSTLGVAYFNSSNFTVTDGAVSAKSPKLSANVSNNLILELPLGSTISVSGANGLQTSLVQIIPPEPLNNLADTFVISALDAAVGNAGATQKGVASFQTGDFTVSSGHISLAATLFTVRDSIGNTEAISRGNTLTLTGGSGVFIHETTTDTFAIRGVTATATTLGVASFPTTYFTVSDGVVNFASAYQVTGDTVTGPNAAITVTKSGRTATIDARLATDSLTGVARFSSSYFSVADGLVTLASAYQTTGDTVNGPNASLKITRDGKSITLDNRFATTSLTGVASFDSRYFDTGTTGHVRIVMVDGGTFT